MTDKQIKSMTFVGLITLICVLKWVCGSVSNLCWLAFAPRLKTQNVCVSVRGDTNIDSCMLESYLMTLINLMWCMLQYNLVPWVLLNQHTVFIPRSGAAPLFVMCKTNMTGLRRAHQAVEWELMLLTASLSLFRVSKITILTHSGIRISLLMYNLIWNRGLEGFNHSGRATSISIMIYLLFLIKTRFHKKTLVKHKSLLFQLKFYC